MSDDGIERYFRMPADDPGTVAQSDQARAEALDAVRGADTFVVITFRLEENRGRTIGDVDDEFMVPVLNALANLYRSLRHKLENEMGEAA